MDLEREKSFLEKEIQKRNYIWTQINFLFFLSKIEFSGKVSILKQIYFSLKEQYRIPMILVFWSSLEGPRGRIQFLIALTKMFNPDSPLVHSAATSHLSFFSGEPNNTFRLNHMGIKRATVL